MGNGRMGRERFAGLCHLFTTPWRYDIVAARIGANQMEDQERRFIPGPGILLLTITLLGVIGAMLRDYNDVRFGLFGAIIWGGATLSAFVLGTAYLSRRLLPIQSDPGWSGGFRLLWKNYLLRLYDVLHGRQRDLRARYSPKPKRRSSVSVLPPSFSYLNAGYLPAHEAAVVAAGNAFSRVVGPGMVILREGETIAQVFDLRPQSRSESVHATTRDGIVIEATVTVNFQVRQSGDDSYSPESVEPGAVPYPYVPNALLQLAYSTGAVDGKKSDWAEQVAPQAAALLISQISEFTLDRLLKNDEDARPSATKGSGNDAQSGDSKSNDDGAGQSGLGLLKTIGDNILRDLKARQDGGSQQVLSKGLEITNVEVVLSELPPEIMAWRLAAWQIERQARIAREAGGNEASRLYQQARARAQADNVEDILRGIDAMQQQGGATLHEIVVSQVEARAQEISSTHTIMTNPTQSALPILANEVVSELRSVSTMRAGED